MAEAHSAVAFSFAVSHEGLHINVNHDALWAVWESGVRSWKKKIGRIKNNFINGVYPASPASWLLTASMVLSLFLANVDPSLGLVKVFQNSIPGIRSLYEPQNTYASCLVFSTLVWLAGIFFLRTALKLLLTYKGWMFEPRGKTSLQTKIWAVSVRLLEGRKPLLYSFQGALPNLPVPTLDGTMRRYLKSVKPLMQEEDFRRMEKLVDEFKTGLGVRLQRYLILKSWWATNYVSDWWEDYVYLRGRSPIMVNSNFYGIDAVMSRPTHVQVARAANIIHSLLQFRRMIDRESLSPIMLNKTVPLCSWQYERMFNTTRIPGIEADTLVHYKDSKHFIVIHRGRYFKVYIHHKGEIFKPCELEIMLQRIIDDPTEPMDGERHLAALTAGDRIRWAKTRSKFFAKGINKNSLAAIEKAAFVLALDEEAQEYDRDDPSKMDSFGRAMLHGKGYDRWFDKSFTFVVCSNGSIGFNAEHSWADAPIMGHAWETAMHDEFIQGYTEDGHTVGQPTLSPPNPIKLQWEIPQECQEVIEESLVLAQDLLNDVDLHILTHDAYGKGFMKKCRTSPDAYIQMALQLAYYRDAGKFSLTYEASMTRLYREGRTETVRSCTEQSCAFVRAMEDKTKTKEECIRLLHGATEVHQDGYRTAMTGKGIDRHLFCLYVVSKYLEVESPFLKEVLSEPWRLSTSQMVQNSLVSFKTPHQQTDKLDLSSNPELISAGGGFGPVADDGYGVSYIIAGEDILFFHISSKKSCSTTDSKRFGRMISKAHDDMKNLFAK
ncbi:Carnitine O-palmitoyltransferase 1, liver [Lamellibrachia satsuma]|nr:Carnitine O-palmitoyltransferase 1, liver [Lamellibrachia satsuma]